jgi:hydrogenase/urease accessory protein HupE
MTFPRTIVASIAFCTLANLARAHEGHGTPGAGNSMVHFLFSPTHLLPLVLFAVALLAIRRFTQIPRTGCVTLRRTGCWSKLHDAPPS